jgi:methionyl-tRNA formyltransferase
VTVLRIVFCGTPEFAVPSLRRIHAHSAFSIEAVITQPDRPRGRGQHLSYSPVKQSALDAGLVVNQPESIKSAPSHDFLKQIAPDAIVIIAYGQIIPSRLLTIPRLGWINLHASLLPRYRGAAPIHWAIANGDTRTGITTMQIDAGMDTGPILLQQEIEIGSEETSPELSLRMSDLGAGLMIDSLLKFDRGEIAPVPQDSLNASKAPILKKEDGRIQWDRPAQQIYNRMRGLTPWPGAFTTFRGQTCHVWGRPGIAEAEARSVPGEIIFLGNKMRVWCGARTCMHMDFVQLEGRKRVSAQEFVNGVRIELGDRFV